MTEAKRYNEQKKNSPVILWGCGYAYDLYRQYIRSEMSVDYVYDRKWEDTERPETYDGHKTICMEGMLQME